jgi:DNA-binding protein HU-beta
MNKGDFIKAVATKANMSQKDAGAAVEAFIAATIDALKAGDSVNLVGFGIFEAKKREARAGINPLTKAPIQIAASVAPNFKAGKPFKDALN